VVKYGNMLELGRHLLSGKQLWSLIQARATISWSSRRTFETSPLCITLLLINEMI
jgi:hypothetical protein